MFQILVAEDDKSAGRLIMDTLADAGYKPVLAADGLQAYAMLTQRHVDLLVLDLMLPELDGFALLHQLRDELSALLPETGLVLVAGLGNRAITPDALGPQTAEQVLATRHIHGEIARITGLDGLRPVAVVSTGVLGCTGVETRELLTALAREFRPSAVIAVDALAARSLGRLGCTIQLSTGGISPGSGVNNARPQLSRETVGVPVIGIGVPTVVDAATIVNDTMENFIAALESSDSLKGVGNVLRSYSAGEKYEFVKELIAPHLNGMYVTPKDVDEMIHQISHTLAEALNMVFAGEA